MNGEPGGPDGPGGPVGAAPGEAAGRRSGGRRWMRAYLVTVLAVSATGWAATEYLTGSTEQAAPPSPYATQEAPDCRRPAEHPVRCDSGPGCPSATPVPHGADSTYRTDPAAPPSWPPVPSATPGADRAEAVLCAVAVTTD